MILTVTANPMVEHLFRVPGFQQHQDFRPTRPAEVVATGKPINCARALRDLGHEVMCVAPVGGSTGREIEELLEAEELPHRLVNIRAESRRGFTVYDDRGQVTTVYGPAPMLRDAEVDAIVATVRSLLPARMLVLGGSSSRPELYARLVKLGVPVVLDTRGEALEQALAAGGDILLAKPNLRECRETFGSLDVERAVHELRIRGAHNAVVTDGANEAVFMLGSRLVRLQPPEVELVHTVGCGDALCAGWIHAHDRPDGKAAAFAMACGSYAASRPGVSRLSLPACEALAAGILAR
jgi:1-phosphofructokinase family hexose kinase